MFLVNSFLFFQRFHKITGRKAAGHILKPAATAKKIVENRYLFLKKYFNDKRENGSVKISMCAELKNS
jgi:hypothetical protein